MMITKKVERFGLVAGSMAFGLVIGIYAAYQFMLGANAYNEKIVDATVEQVQVEDSRMSDYALADVDDSADNVEEVFYLMMDKRDGGGLASVDDDRDRKTSSRK